MRTLSREEVLALADAPYGQAAKTIRTVDPLWGRKPGEKIKWRVKLVCEQPMVAYETVEAASEKEALELAQDFNPNALDWESASSPFAADYDIESAEPQP